jgi:hypothetical protein
MHGPSREEFDAYQSAKQILRRGTQIVHGMQASAARAGLPPLGEDDQRAALEIATSIPASAVGPVVSSIRRPWEQDFPVPVATVLAVAKAQPAAVLAKHPPLSTERRVPS